MSKARILGALGVGMVWIGLMGGCVGPSPQDAAPLPRPRQGQMPLPPPPAGAEVNPALKAAAREELVAALGSNSPVVRAHAVEAVREALGSGGRAELLRALQDQDALVRFAATMAVGEIRLEEAQGLVLRLLNDKSPHVQIGAIFALHRLGNVQYSSGLEEALNSPEAEVRANAAFALGRLGEPSAVRILRPALRDRAVEVRLQVAEALWRLGDEDGLRYLVAAGLSGHPAHQMVGLLGLAGPRDARVIEHVRAGKESDYLEVVLVAARALGMLGSDEACVVAMETTRSGDARQRYLAALALGAIARVDAQDWLAPLLRDADPDVRVAAAAAILQLR